MLRNFTIASWLILIISSVAMGQFFEDWDDLNGASRWSAPIVALEDPNIAFDGNVNYAFDYSIIGASSAPNSTGGTTIGVSMESNRTDQCPADPNCTDSDEGEGLGIVPLSSLGQIPSGDFRLTTDAYLFWNGESGSTEYTTIGVFSGGTAVPVRFGIDSGDGLAWSMDSEAGSTTDLYRFENPPGSENGLGGWEDIPFGSIPGFNTGTPGVDFPANQFAGPANRWIELEVESVGGTVTFSVNGYQIDSFDNSTGQFSGGSLMIGHSDPFNSVNPPDANGNLNMAVFDNIRLESITGVTGDFNTDGMWDCNDIDALVAAIAAGDHDLAFDMNGDGTVTLADISDSTSGWLVAGGAESAATLGNPFLMADANLDGVVDVSDYGAWVANRFGPASDMAGWCGGDFNADGFVDVSDLSVFTANKFMSSIPTSVVPEPSSLAGMLVLVFISVVGRRRRHAIA